MAQIDEDLNQQEMRRRRDEGRKKERNEKQEGSDQEKQNIVGWMRIGWQWDMPGMPLRWENDSRLSGWQSSFFWVRISEGVEVETPGGPFLHVEILSY